MPTVKMVEYEDAARKCAPSTTTSWRCAARLRAQLLEDPGRAPADPRKAWEGIKRVMAPGRLDPVTKEMIAIAVSATNGCEYCIRSHTAAARKLGMDDETLSELMAVVGMFNQTNKLVFGYQVDVDEAFKGRLNRHRAAASGLTPPPPFE